MGINHGIMRFVQSDFKVYVITSDLFETQSLLKSPVGCVFLFTYLENISTRSFTEQLGAERGLCVLVTPTRSLEVKPDLRAIN